MIKFSVKIKSIQKIPPLALSTAQTKIVGKTAIGLVKQRVQQKHTDVNDSKMAAYSNKPIYVQVGVSRSGGVRQAVIKSGRVPIAALASLKHAGVNIIDARKTGLSKGALKNKIVRTGNSIRFPNRAAYKRFLGKSGERDLTETGAMLAAMVITSQSGTYAKVIALGFKNSTQDKKARGNTNYADWFGLSPSDQNKVLKVVSDIFSENLGLPTQFGASRGFGTISTL